MKLKIGSPATGQNFFDRPVLRARLLRSLHRDHVAFIGPRRTGKTSLLKNIEKNPPEGIQVMFLNLEKFDNVPDWLHAMIGKLSEQLKCAENSLELKGMAKRVASLLTRIEKIEIMGSGVALAKDDRNPQFPWRTLADEFVACLRQVPFPLYFLLDEFPWFLAHVARERSVSEVEALLNWFRSVRQENGEQMIRFLVTGSIGLDGLLRRMGLSPAANDFDTLEIPPLTETEALAFLETLTEGEGVPLSVAGRREILHLLGTSWPILLALFVSEIQEAGIDGPLSKADLRKIYRQQLVQGPRNKYCQEMFTRITKPEVFSASERRLALEILRVLIRRKGLTSAELETIHAQLVPDESVRTLLNDELAFVVDALRHDGYLVRDKSGQHSFASRILRDYWEHRSA